jgi:hypothetical protein
MPYLAPPNWPLLFVTVTTPRDQAALHRDLANLGYTPERLSVESDGTERWVFQHPDGERYP